MVLGCENIFMKGWIGLDIDGTITTDKYSVPQSVVDFLHATHLEGWQIALATGRAFSFAKKALKNFNFPYFILPQNGSCAISQPDETVLFTSYMDGSILDSLESLFTKSDTDFIVYTGVENQDRCFYRKDRFSLEILSYLEDVQARDKEPWQEVKSFSSANPIALIKAFGRHDKLKKIAMHLNKNKIANACLIKDPFHPTYFILLVTDVLASKGSALQKLILQSASCGAIVVAGDDENDLSLFKVADIKIAMPHAPEDLRKAADFVAPPVQEMGIIKALNIVIKNISNKAG